MSVQFNSQKHFYFKVFSLVKRFKYIDLLFTKLLLVRP